MDKKVILVTGASSGFGKEAVNLLLEQGHTVYAASRRIDKMYDIEKKGAIIIPLDITSDEQVEDVVKQVIKKSKKIDVLVNSAGYGSFGAIENVSMEEVYYQFEVNVFGTMKMIKAVIPHMRKQKSGKIINVSSIVGRESFPLTGWYGASKFAIEGLSNSLRMETKDFGIKVVILQPGAMNTGFEEISMKKLEEVNHDEEYQRFLEGFIKAQKSNFKKAPGPEKVARKIVEICNSKNPKSRYLVGADAKLLGILGRILPDKVLDAIIRSTLGFK